MPSNTNGEAQKQRRRDAWKSAIIATVWMLLSASMVLLLRHFYVPEGFWSAELQKKLQSSLIKGEYVEISSTNLRKDLLNRANVEHIINKDVLLYIEKHGLYR